MTILSVQFSNLSSNISCRTISSSIHMTQTMTTSKLYMTFCGFSNNFFAFHYLFGMTLTKENQDGRNDFGSGGSLLYILKLYQISIKSWFRYLTVSKFWSESLKLYKLDQFPWSPNLTEQALYGGMESWMYLSFQPKIHWRIMSFWLTEMLKPSIWIH